MIAFNKYGSLINTWIFGFSLSYFNGCVLLNCISVYLSVLNKLGFIVF